MRKENIDSLTLILEEENDEDLDKLIKVVNEEIEYLPPKRKKIFLLSKKKA